MPPETPSALCLCEPGAKYLRWLALSALAAAPAFGQVTTNIAWDATTNALTQAERDQVASHLAEAMRRWSRLLVIDGPRSIEVTVSISNQPTASARSAVGVPIDQVGGRDLLEQCVAYELRTGVDMNGPDPDMYLDIGLAHLRNDWWFDPDPASRSAPVPGNRTDAMSSFLHEVGHAIAYNGWADPTTGIPPTTHWSTFDRWMIPGAPTVFSGPWAVASRGGTAPDLTTGNNKHWANPSHRLFAPPVQWQPMRPTEWKHGLPVPPMTPAPPTMPMPTSLDAIVAEDPLILQLMNGIVFLSGHRYNISSLDIAVLRDVGLPLDALFTDGFD